MLTKTSVFIFLVISSPVNAFVENNQGQIQTISTNLQAVDEFIWRSDKTAYESLGDIRLRNVLPQFEFGITSASDVYAKIITSPLGHKLDGTSSSKFSPEYIFNERYFLNAVARNLGYWLSQCAAMAYAHVEVLLGFLVFATLCFYSKSR